MGMMLQIVQMQRIVAIVNLWREPCASESVLPVGFQLVENGERETMSQPRLVAALPLLGAVLLGGCATRDYVREQVAELEARQNDRIEGIDKTAQDALMRADAAGKLAEGKFIYSVVVTDDTVKFPTNKWALSPDAQAKLAALAQKLIADNKNVFLEIQGFTDDVGNPDYNLQLGQSRANAAFRFLHRKGIAASRMSAISYGAENPIAPNDTPEGRATNRRIAVIVLN